MNWGYFTPKEAWEIPECNFCHSKPETHKLILANVHDYNINLVECPSCCLRFYSPRPKFDDMVAKGFLVDNASKIQAEKFYYNTSFYDVPDTEKQRVMIKKYYTYIIKKYESVISKPKSIFEVAGLVGIFLAAVRDCGIEELYGCEINPWAVQIAQEKLGLTNMEIGNFNHYSPRKLDYDCVVMLDYIEHSYYPFNDLWKLTHMLRPGGGIIIKTFLEELDPDKIMTDPVGHFTHFFRKTLIRMIEECECTPVFERIESDCQILIIAKRNG